VQWTKWGSAGKEVGDTINIAKNKLAWCIFLPVWIINNFWYEAQMQYKTQLKKEWFNGQDKVLFNKG
jgi:hypothetical protein